MSLDAGKKERQNYRLAATLAVWFAVSISLQTWPGKVKLRSADAGANFDPARKKGRPKRTVCLIQIRPIASSERAVTSHADNRLQTWLSASVATVGAAGGLAVGM